MRYQEGVTSLKHKRDRRFLLSGTEPYLKESFVKIARSVYPGSECHIFYPENEAEAAGFVHSDAMFEGRIIVLKSFEKMNAKKFESVPEMPGDCLIFVVTDRVDPRSKSMAGVIGKVPIVDCDRMREYGTDYPTWVSSKVAEAGYTMKDGLEELIYSKVGPSMFTLYNELEKLFILKEGTKVITEDDINSGVSITAASTVYDILNSLLRRDAAGALGYFKSYSKVQEGFVELVGFLSNYMEKLYRMLLLHESKTQPDDIADIIGLPRFLVKTRYMPRALSMGKTEVARRIDQLCNLDVQLRRFKGSKIVLMEHYILSFAK